VGDLLGVAAEVRHRVEDRRQPRHFVPLDAAARLIRNLAKLQEAERSLMIVPRGAEVTSWTRTNTV